MTTETLPEPGPGRQRSDKHEYELEPRRLTGGGYKAGRMIPASAAKRNDVAFRSAMGLAETILAEREDIGAIGVYHTYPNAGPVRRYVREVTRAAEIDPARQWARIVGEG